jgi:flagellar export protein FliJ
MQKFHFRLDTVLRLRSVRLAAEREKLSKALAENARIEEAIAALAAERKAAVEFVKVEKATGSSELRALSAYLLGHETRAQKLMAALEKARLNVAEQRRRVMAADRDERLLLKLKEKRRAEWQDAVDRELETLAQESWNAVHFEDRSS